MKGFLHRTLESARGAEPRIKPLAGTVYAGNLRRQESQRENWGEETVFASPAPADSIAPRQHTQQGAAQTAPPAEILLPLRSQPSEFAAGGYRNLSESPQSATVAHSTASSLVVHADAQSAMRSASQRDPIHVSMQPLLPLRTDIVPLQSGLKPNEPLNAESTAPQVTQQAARAEKIQRLEDLNRAAPVSSPQHNPSMGDRVAAKPPIASPQMLPLRNRPQQEPQVQVHIGRIEVIAAAPQPARVPTPRPSRATSLADYLAGRNGRSS